VHTTLKALVGPDRFSIDKSGSPSCMPIQEESCNRFTLQVIGGSEIKT
jgi:hypothetical protein